jgi:hypothetical protein
MAAQAQEAITVKSKNGKEAFLFNKRIVLDLRGRPIVRNNYQSTRYYPRTDTIVMYVSSHDEAVAIRQVKAENLPDNKQLEAIYDLSGRKVSRPVKGIYIQNGKKIAVK